MTSKDTMRSSSTATALSLILTALGPAWGCGDDGQGSEIADPETSGDGDGDGDGDTETETSGDGDGDGDSGDGDGDGGDGDGDGEGAEPCTWEWEATQMKVNGQIHAAFDVDVAPSGEFVAVGRIANGTSDAWIAKFSADGQMAWEQVVDSGGYDLASGVALDDAGDLIVVGSLQGNNNKDLWIEKRSGGDGSTAWTVTEVSNFDGDNSPGDVALAPDGSIVVSGSVRMGDDDTDVWVRKLSSADGAPAWTATFSGNTDMSGFSIDKGGQLAIAPDGSVYVGAEEGVDFETRDAVLLKFGPDGGAAQWKLAPGVSGDPHMHDPAGVAAGPDGEAYFAMVQTSSGIERLWLHRSSPAGDVEWTLTQDDFVYDPTRSWTIAGLDIGDDGNLTVGGGLRNEETGEGIDWGEVWVANISLAGQGLCLEAHTWQNEHIIPASTFNYGLAEGPGGTVVVGEVRDGPENYLWVGGFN